MENITRYKVLQIDVWGNEDEGFERNDYYTIGEIELSEGDNIINSLIDGDYLNEIARETVISDSYCESCIDILIKDNRKPLLELQLID